MREQKVLPKQALIHWLIHSVDISGVLSRHNSSFRSRTLLASIFLLTKVFGRQWLRVTHGGKCKLAHGRGQWTSRPHRESGTLSSSLVSKDGAMERSQFCFCFCLCFQISYLIMVNPVDSSFSPFPLAHTLKPFPETPTKQQLLSSKQLLCPTATLSLNGPIHVC